MCWDVWQYKRDLYKKDKGHFPCKQRISKIAWKEEYETGKNEVGVVGVEDRPNSVIDCIRLVINDFKQKLLQQRITYRNEDQF